MNESPNSASTQSGNWSVYIIEADDGRFYTGITIDIERRWQQHLEGKLGAKFFRGRMPARLLYLEAGHNRSSASKREAAIKKLSRKEKEILIATTDFCGALQPGVNAARRRISAEKDGKNV